MTPQEAQSVPASDPESVDDSHADDPVGPPAVRMNWENLLFLHWRVDPRTIRSLLPDQLTVDTFDGSAWIGLVPFRMADCSFRGVPALPGLANFFECNVRTYASYRGKKGVWFFSLDAQTLLPVLGGRMLWNLNYVYSRFGVSRDGDCTDYSLVRRTPWPLARWPLAQTRIRWRTGELLEPDATKRPLPPETLEHFLTERYWLFTMRNNKVMGGQIRHDPWPLRHAEVLMCEDSLVAAAGMQVFGPPIALASDHIAVEGFALRSL